MKTKKLRRDRERACGEPESTQDSDNCPDIGKHDYFYPETETQHTPTPWKLGVNKHDGQYWIENEVDAFTGHLSDVLKKEDAAFIVRAVNAYEKDQALIKELLELAKDYRGDLINHLGIWTKERIEQIIARCHGIAEIRNLPPLEKGV